MEAGPGAPPPPASPFPPLPCPALACRADVVLLPGSSLPLKLSHPAEVMVLRDALGQTQLDTRRLIVVVRAGGRAERAGRPGGQEGGREGRALGQGC